MRKHIAALLSFLIIISIAGGAELYSFAEERLGSEIKNQWVTEEDGRYYLDGEGQCLKGFADIGEDKYYFDPDTGKMASGFMKIDGKTYYFGKTTGKMYTGMKRIKGNVYTFDDNGVLIRTVYGDKKAVALTYDDGPSVHTPVIVEALKKNGGLATFFVVGNRIESYRSVMKTTVASGCQIANHSWNHSYYQTMKKNEVKRQIDRCNTKITKYTGREVTVCRTPGGDRSKGVLENVGMPVILWSVDTRDWATQSADATYNSVMNNVYDGAVILMHDLYKSTADASVKFIPELKKKGYQLVTVDELALLRGYKLKDGKVYSRFKKKK